MSFTTCVKLFDNFKVSWDPEILTKDSPEIESKEQVYSDPTGKMHWQVFKSTNVAFGRNFFRNYYKECTEVVDYLQKIKDNLPPSENKLVDVFRTHTINPGGINLIKTFPGKNIKLHKDVTRQYCLNIGLKNSNKWQSFISTQPNLEKYKENESISYILEDGEGYLLDINNPHCAICLNPNDNAAVRYVLTYTYSVIKL